MCVFKLGQLSGISIVDKERPFSYAAVLLLLLLLCCFVGVVVAVFVGGGGVCCVFLFGCIWITVFTINNIFGMILVTNI